MLRATLLCLSVFLSLAASAQEFRTKADKAYMIDAETGTVLFAKNEDVPVPPASLAKIMTMEVVFNEIKSGRLSLDDEFVVSENAWRTGGAVSHTSTMFAEIHSSIRVEDLIKGAIIQSGNDSCIVLAEGIAGSEQAFARKMTERARELGMETSVFANSTGLPNPGSKVTMRELVMLAKHTQEAYPEFYKWYAEPEFKWNGINQRNRNPLLRYDMGVDGLKTGYTEESGYGIVASVKRDDRRLLLAMSGMASEKEREEEARKMLEWGLRTFEKHKLFDANQVIGTVGVFDGNGTGVDLVPKDPVYVYLPIVDADRLKARIVYDWPLKAPVEQGDQIGRLKIWIGDTLSQETPLYAANDVPVGPLHWRAFGALQELLFFWL
jgi:D-alanyl-D-alanine carboxypeptidase (penicillin-binding protein 5/6)